MIWAWRTFFSLLAAAAAAHASSVSGRVQLDGRARDYSGVVVSLWPAAGAPGTAAPERHARMVQKNKTFNPHVLPVQVGTTVEFPNYDPIFHNAFSNYDGQVFDVGLYPPGTSQNVVFHRAGVVRIFCNIHSNMSAVIVVLPTPYFATSRADGSFEIAGVPPGQYTLHVFHERGTPAALRALERRITVADEPVSLAPITVSEAGYLPIPHKNKYGKDYPAENPDDTYLPK